MPPCLMLPDGHLPRVEEGLVRQAGGGHFHHRMFHAVHPRLFNFQHAYAHGLPSSCYLQHIYSIITPEVKVSVENHEGLPFPFGIAHTANIIRMPLALF